MNKAVCLSGALCRRELGQWLDWQLCLVSLGACLHIWCCNLAMGGSHCLQLFDTGKEESAGHTAGLSC